MSHPKPSRKAQDAAAQHPLDTLRTDCRRDGPALAVDPGLLPFQDPFLASGVKVPHWKIVLAVLVFLAITLRLFWAATRGGFVNLDDPAYVVENSIVQQGLKPAAILAAFTAIHERANWIPLTMLSLQLDTALFGHEAWGYHFTNILLHVFNAGLVYWLFRRITGSPGVALLIAALFAWHPLRVESVAWISERKDVLSACWGLLAIHAYFSYVRRPSWSFMALVFVCMLASLVVKPMLVTLPFLLLLLDAWPLRRVRIDKGQGCWRDILFRVVEKIPLIALSLLFSILTYFTQLAGDAVRTDGGSLLRRIMQAASNFAHYLRVTFVPHGLAIAYGESDVLPEWQVLFGAVVVSGMVWVAWKCARRLPSVTVGLCWFAGLLVPVIGLVSIGAVNVSDRYTYLPSIGLAWALVVLSLALARRFRMPGAVVPVAGVSVLFLLVALTHSQITTWANSLALYGHAVKIAPRHPAAHAGLALALQTAGRADEALASYGEAIRLDPSYIPSHLNRALLLVETGRAAESLEALRNVWSWIPGSWMAAALNTRAMALDHVGRPEEAEKDLRAALDLEPNLREARLNLGIAFWKSGRKDDALDAFKRVCETYPNDPSPWILSGRLLAESGRHREAARHFEAAYRIRPDDLVIANLLGVSLGDAGQFEQASSILDKTLAAYPDNPITLNNLSMLYLKVGAAFFSPSNALSLARQATEWTGHRDPAILDTLASAFAANGEYAEAVRTAETALSLTAGKDAPWIAQLEANVQTWRRVQSLP